MEYMPSGLVDEAVLRAAQLEWTVVTNGAEFDEDEPSTNAPVELDDFGSRMSPVTDPEEAG